MPSERPQIMKMIPTTLLKPLVFRSRILTTMYRFWRDSCASFGTPEETPHGFRLCGNRAMQSGLFEVEETELVKSILPKVDVLLNVGANIGYYCCMAKAAGKYVVAFEPIASNIACLLKNLQANHWLDNLEIYPIAASDRTGLVEIFGGGTGASTVKGWAGTPEGYVTVIPANTIDIVLGSRFTGKRCLCIIDVEGGERHILEGARIFLAAEPKPIWLVEICISDHQPRGVDVNPELYATFELFWDSGYDAFTASKGRRRVDSAEIREIVRTKTNSLLTHNFLFVERGTSEQIVNVM